MLLQQLIDKSQSIDHIIIVWILEKIELEMEENEVMTAKVLNYKRKVEEALFIVISRRSLTTSIIKPTPVASTSNVKAHLPKITLLKFHSWSHSTLPYTRTIKYQKINKFNYLNSLLKRLASRTIQGLSSNCDSAVELLQTRLGNPNKIITAHMNELIKLPNCVGEKFPH